jgi:acetyl-CoA/propionyl-CoA carboxylase biotin carboxyl carrier protein
MFSTVLVANRGEIACRVLRTVGALGIRSVAVYSDADRNARHVRLADVAVRIGPAAPAHSYLDIAALIAAAQASGAEAIHPGYGFLSENAHFAQACAAAGIVFIGPGVEALAVMGDKIRAKAHVTRANVPVVQGTTDPGLSDAELVAAAGRIGYPLLIKPSAGGGGKGMIVVERASNLPDGVRAARRVATGAFGDDTLLLERYLPSARHLEVQVLADTHGGIVHLGERECSLQRRHQKVIEEAPSPLLDGAARQRLGNLACDVARSVGYVGAGTVEFLVSNDAPDNFFFMEMNTRLQVEHPVTELVTGIDLVEWQLRIAAGQPLTLEQGDIRITGHAVEARVYAEDPARGFLPSTGRILLLDEPAGAGIRVDSALAPGLSISADYDPLLSKLIAWAPDRAGALSRLDAALAATTVLGVHTNIEFLRQVLNHPAVRTGHLDTSLLERLLPGFQFRAADPAALTAAVLWGRDADVGGGAWRGDGWRMGDDQPTRYALVAGTGPSLHVAVWGPAEEATVLIGDGDPLPASLVRLDEDTASLELDGVVRTFRIVAAGGTTWVGQNGWSVGLRLRSDADRLADELAAITRPAGMADPEIRSPMPGTVVAVSVATGDPVTTGQTLVRVEAMKMEHQLTATADGIVTVTVRPADLVSLDQVVATITPHPQEEKPA